MGKYCLEGKRAVVTGAGSGIGRELCLQLAKTGCRVEGADINERSLHETRNILNCLGGSMACHTVDVADRARVAAFAGEVVSSGGVDIVINNAGVAMSDISVEDIALPDLEWIMNCNFWGTVHVTKAFIPALKKSDDAYLVNTSSIYGICAMENAAGYTASKFAVRGFSEALVQEMHGTKVRVMTVFPGGIKTGIAVNSRWLGRADDTAAQQRQLARFENLSKTSAQDAAGAILDAMRRTKKRLLIGRDSGFMDLLVRCNPAGYDGFVRKHISRR